MRRRRPWRLIFSYSYDFGEGDAYGRGLLGEEDHEGLEDGIGEAGANGYPFDDAFDVVHDDDVQGGLVRIGEDLIQVLDLGHLAEANHVLGRGELDEGELRGLGDGGCEGGLPRAGRAVEQDREQRGGGRVAYLIHEGAAVVEDVLDIRAVVQDTAVYGVRQLLFGNTKGGLHFVEGFHEVSSIYLHRLDIVGNTRYRPDLYVAVEGE
jgi:hypothetical protein